MYKRQCNIKNNLDITLFCNKSWIVPFKSKLLSLFSSLLRHKSADKGLYVHFFFLFSDLLMEVGGFFSFFSPLFVAQLLSQTATPLSKERSYNILLKMIGFFQQRHHPRVAGFTPSCWWHHRHHRGSPACRRSSDAALVNAGRLFYNPI